MCEFLPDNPPNTPRDLSPPLSLKTLRADNTNRDYISSWLTAQLVLTSVCLAGERATTVNVLYSRC